MNKLIFILLASLLSACSSSVKHGSNVIVIHVEESIDREEQANRLARINNYVTIPLETPDSIIIYGAQIYGEYNDKMIVCSNNTICYFNKNGALEHSFCKYGNGPGEYLSINDFAFNSSTGELYIHDLQKRVINKYDRYGTFIKSVKNDSIAAIMMNDDGNFITTYSPSEQWNYHIGIYDSLFNTIGSFCKRNIPKNDTDYLTINSVHNFGKCNYVLLSDTLYSVFKDRVTPFLVIDKGSLKLPENIDGIMSKRNEKENYIWGDYLFLVGDYCFLSYNFKGNVYYDIYSISSRELVLRNRVPYESDDFGVPFLLGEKRINLWPKSVVGNSVYFVLDGELMQEVIPTRKDDDNPIVITVDVNDFIFDVET